MKQYSKNPQQLTKQQKEARRNKSRRRRDRRKDAKRLSREETQQVLAGHPAVHVRRNLFSRLARGIFRGTIGKTRRVKEAKPLPDNREFPCPKCDTGEMSPEGFTQPNGQRLYQCSDCSHGESFP